MAFVTWVPNADGDWDTASNWSGGVLPTSADTVVISTTTEHTITHSTGNDFAGSLSVGNDLFSMTGGSLTVLGAVSMANGFSMSGGTSTMGTTASISGTFHQLGGTLSVDGVLTVSGEAELQGGYLGASTIMQASGPVVLANYTLGGGAQIQNTTTIYQTGNITLGDSSGVGVLIATAAGATYDFANAVTISEGAATAQITNAGTLAALVGTGASAISVSASSTGVVSAATGSTLTFQGPLTSLSGTIIGAGTVAIGGGNATLASATTVNVGTFSLNGGTLTLAGSHTIIGAFAQSGSSTLALGGYTLTLSGKANFTQSGSTPYVSGGTLVTSGATSIGGTGTGVSLASAASWTNSGSLNTTQSIQLGNSSTGTALMTNAATGTFAIAAAGVSVSSGSTPISRLVNAGVLEMTANSGTSFIRSAYSSTGTVTAAQYTTLEFDGSSGTLAGVISGAGQVAFAGGTGSIGTLASGSTVTAGTLALYNTGTDLAISGNVTISGGYAQSAGTTLSLAGHTLTLAGNAAFSLATGTPLVSGSGLLVTDGNTNIAGSGLTIGNTLGWSNYGVVTDAATVTIGSTSGTSSLFNRLGHVFDLVSSGIGVNNGSMPPSIFQNNGTFEVTANGGVDTVGSNVTNGGTILATQSDNLEFNGAVNSITGSLGGTGQISFGNGGTTTILANTKITVGTLALQTTGTNLVIGGSVTDAGSYMQSDGSDLTLSASTFTVTGSAHFQQNSNTPDVNGTGALVTKGTTTTTGGAPLIIGGASTWVNDGVVYQDGNLQIGDNGNSSASVTNALGATFLINVNNVEITKDSSSADFVNAGTLEIAAGVSPGSDNVNTASTGTVLASQGTNLVFGAATDSFAGALTGAGQISFATGSNTIAAGTTLTVAKLSLYGVSTTLSLTGNDTISSALAEQDSSVIALGANVLTLTGAAQFTANSGSPDVNGTGTLVTQGTTTLINGSVALKIGGSATWSNTGTVLDTATALQIGDSNGASAQIVNQAGALFDILANGVTITNGSTPYSSLVNAGTLEMAANGGTAYVETTASSTGMVSVLQGDNLVFEGQNSSFNGTITGAGTLSIGVGSDTIAGGTVINIGTLSEYTNGTTLALGGNVTDSGAFSQSMGSTLNLVGHTLTLAGNAQFQQNGGSPLVMGPGTLVTDGVTSLTGTNPALILGGTAAWDNYGTVLDYYSFQVGNSSSAAASVVNEAGATFDLVAGVGINNGSTPVSTFTNAGLLEMTSFGGTSSMNEALTNTGTVLAQGGRMNFLGPVSGTGTLEISAGGELGFSSTVGSTQMVDFLDNTGSMSLTLTTPTSFGAEISGFAQGDTIDLTGIASTSVTETFSGGVLTFTNTTSHAVVAALHFSNSPNFTFVSDGNGGTLIGDPQR